MTSDIQFFCEHGRRYADTTPAEHYERAEQLAAAERWAYAVGVQFEWLPEFMEGHSYDAYPWSLVATLGGERIAVTLGVEFDDNDEESPLTCPALCRVEEAELALRAMECVEHEASALKVAA